MPVSKELYSQMPRLGAPFVDPETGILSQVWYRFLLSIFAKLGGSRTLLTSFVYVQETTPNQGEAFNATTQVPVNLVAGSISTGGPAQVLALGSNPFIYTATVSGLLTVFGGEIELRRTPAGVFRNVGLTGGALRLLPNDAVRITWFSALAPDPVVWYPDV